MGRSVSLREMSIELDADKLQLFAIWDQSSEITRDAQSLRLRGQNDDISVDA